MSHTPTELECELIRKALEEDIGSGDITSNATIPAEAVGIGRIRSQGNAVLAGLPYSRRVFEELDKTILFQEVVSKGNRVSPGEIVATVRGPLRSLLAGERLALNLLRHLSGVATITADFVKAVAGTKAKITDTRKTTPLWRAAEKNAVRTGGGVNHRSGLFDHVLLKDNHIDANDSIQEAIKKARRALGPETRITVEIRDEKEIEPALSAGATRLLLDNMEPEQLAGCVRLIGGRAETEASGNVTITSVREIAETGVDFISIGALTHSVPAADFNMKIEKIR